MQNTPYFMNFIACEPAPGTAVGGNVVQFDTAFGSLSCNHNPAPRLKPIEFHHSLIWRFDGGAISHGDDATYA
jgi:hypothetical protein